ncbi:MAG: DNA polymerase III subunit delta [Jiangellales bacterium]
MLEPVNPPGRPPAPVTLVSGPEAFLRERAVADVVGRARAADPDVDVTWLSAAETTPGSLGEAISPSLFAAGRVAVLEGLDECSDDLASAVQALAADPPEGAVVVLVHPGGNKGKRLLDGLRKAGVPETRCEAPKGGELVDFVVAEARSHKGRIDPETASKLVDVLGGDLRGLASMTEQLVVDGEGVVTLDLVSQYVDGRADVKGWAVADLTVTGQTAKALAELRWALAGGTDAVLVVGALAGSLRTLTMLTAMPRGHRDADVARDLKVPTWKVRVLRGQLRGWSSDGLSRAMRSVAAADLAIKGGSSDPTLALSETVLAVCEARDAT